jgi:hypothetical protein
MSEAILREDKGGKTARQTSFELFGTDVKKSSRDASKPAHPL